MATDITSTSNGIGQAGTRLYTVGQASGLNTQALIDVAYKQKLLPADRIDVKIDKNMAKVDGYTQLRTLTQAVQSSLTNLRKNYSVTASGNAFDMKTGSMSTNNGVNPTSIVNVTPGTGAATGDYELEVIQKAQAHKVASAIYADSSTALGLTGTFDIGLAGGATANVNITGTMTLQDIANEINAQRLTSGVGATVMKIANNQFKLVLSANETNKNITYNSTGGTNIFQSLGVTNGGGVYQDVIQAALPSLLELDGVPIQRDSNSINDLLTGVVFDIQNQSPGTVIDLRITEDASQVKGNIEAFVAAYNELRDYILENQKVESSGEVSEDAPLFGDFNMRSLSNQLNGVFSTTLTTPDGLSSLRDIGIKVIGGNKLEISDSTVLDNALLTKFDSVRALFETQAVSNNQNFRMVANTSTVVSQNTTFDITYSAGTITGVTANGTGGLFDISGTLIKGKEGTIYQGMSFAYIGTTNATVTFSLDQGVADLMSNNASLYSDNVTGMLTKSINSLVDQNTDLSSEAETIRSRAEDYRLRLLEQYGIYESKIQASKALLKQLRAILGTDKNDN